MLAWVRTDQTKTTDRYVQVPVLDWIIGAGEHVLFAHRPVEADWIENNRHFSPSESLMRRCIVSVSEAQTGVRLLQVRANPDHPSMVRGALLAGRWTLEDNLGIVEQYICRHRLPGAFWNGNQHIFGIHFPDVGNVGVLT